MSNRPNDVSRPSLRIRLGCRVPVHLLPEVTRTSLPSSIVLWSDADISVRIFKSGGWHLPRHQRSSRTQSCRPSVQTRRHSFTQRISLISADTDWNVCKPRRHDPFSLLPNSEPSCLGFLRQCKRSSPPSDWSSEWNSGVSAGHRAVQRHAPAPRLGPSNSGNHQIQSAQHYPDWML